MSEKITVEEWRAALEEVEAPSQDAYTVKGWAERLGKSERGAAEWVRIGLEHGWVERATATIMRLTGTQCKTVGFRLKEKAK